MSTQGVRVAQLLFDGRRLTLARLYRGLLKAQVGRAIGLTPAAIGQYEQGRSRPSASVVAALALHLDFPPEFFEGERPFIHIGEDQAHFRRLRSTTKMDRSRLLARLALSSELVTMVERHVRLPEVAIPDVSAHGEQASVAEAAAGWVRREWQLGLGPISHMIRLLETKGVIVTRPTVRTRDVDAFSCWAAQRPVVVLARDKDDSARSRFDAAHELGHLVLHHDAQPGGRKVEKQAQEFAAAFLMPADTISKELPRRIDWPRYFALKRRWGVSLAALLERSRSLGMISPDTYQRAQRFRSVNHWRDREPVDLGPDERPVLLERALHLMEQSLGIGRDRLAHDLRVRDTEFTSLLSDAIAPSQPTVEVKLEQELPAPSGAQA